MGRRATVPPAEPEAFHAKAREALAERGQYPAASPLPPAQSEAPGGASANGVPPSPSAAPAAPVLVSSEDCANVESVIEAVLRLVELGLAFVAPKPSRELGRRAEATAVRAAERGAAQVKGAFGSALGPIGFFCAIGVAPGLAGFAKSVRVKRAKAAKAKLQRVQEQEPAAGGMP